MQNQPRSRTGKRARTDRWRNWSVDRSGSKRLITSLLSKATVPELAGDLELERAESRCCRSVVRRRLRPLDLVRARGRRRRGHRKRPAASDGGLVVAVCLVWFLRDRFGRLIEAFLKRLALLIGCGCVGYGAAASLLLSFHRRTSYRRKACVQKTARGAECHFKAVAPLRFPSYLSISHNSAAAPAKPLHPGRGRVRCRCWPQHPATHGVIRRRLSHRPPPLSQ